MAEQTSSFEMHAEPDMTLVAKQVNAALVDMRDELVVRDIGQEAVTVTTGRTFPDGDRVYLRVWTLPNRKDTFVVSDGGVTYARVGMNETETPDLALSIRYDMLKHLPVQDIGGQIVVYTRANGLAEAIGLVADSCIFLDTAVLVATHMRPRPSAI